MNEEARALEADGVDVIQFDEPAFNVYMGEVSDWGIEALRARDRGPEMHDRRAHLLRLRHQGQYRLEGRRSATSGGSTRRFFPALAKSKIDQVSVECTQFARADRALCGCLKGKDVLVGAIDVASDTIETPEEVAGVIGRGR